MFSLQVRWEVVRTCHHHTVLERASWPQSRTAVTAIHRKVWALRFRVALRALKNPVSNLIRTFYENCSNASAVSWCSHCNLNPTLVFCLIFNYQVHFWMILFCWFELQTSEERRGSEVSCSASETGSIITNPAFQRQKLSHQSFRSTVSDSEFDPQQVRTTPVDILHQSYIYWLSYDSMEAEDSSKVVKEQDGLQNRPFQRVSVTMPEAWSTQPEHLVQNRSACTFSRVY